MKEKNITIYTKEKGVLNITRKEWVDLESKNLILHRTDGPALTHWHGGKEYYLNGKLHRTDGPAIDYQFLKQYWIDDCRYSRILYNKIIKKQKQEE